MNNQQKRLQRIRVGIMRDPKWRHLVGVMMLGNHEVVERCPSAYTDGKNTRYGLKFVQQLSDSEFRAVILHETFHVMYRHLTIWKHLYKKNAMLANWACDLVINTQIEEAGEKLPAGVARDPLGRFKGMNAGAIFKAIEELSDDDSQGLEGLGDGQGFDDHDWEEAAGRSEKEEKQLAEEVAQAIREGVLAAGKNPGALNRELLNLMASKVNWKEALREFISTLIKGSGYSTWQRPKRRFLASGVYLPTEVNEGITHLVMAIDTSGSVDTHQMTQFISEVQGAINSCPPNRLDVMYWDTHIAGHEVYEGNEVFDMALQTSPKGGGGTNVECVFKEVERIGMEPDCIVILTDGYTGYPEAPSTPTLFVMNTDNTAPFGQTVKI